jgi:rhamnulokinase
MSMVSCVAVDLGASNGRVVVVDWDGERLSLREARRFDTPRKRDRETGYQCWDLDGIESEVVSGLRSAVAMAPAVSVGVDSWAVDYVLVDAARRPVAPAVSYRDDRTRGMVEEVLARISAGEVYRRTGIQFQPFNTLYQLAATARHHPAWLARARHLLLLPDYLHVVLGGAVANEYTNATTTQLCDLAGEWDDELLAAAGASRALVSSPVAPGTVLGQTAALGGRRLAVIAPASHDTASAVAAIPLAAEHEAYISSGTWSLMGVESARPLAGDDARRLNFTNEGGVERRYRVLKNIAGLWLTQRIGAELGRDAAELAAAAQAAAPWRSLVDPDDARLLNPPSMVAALRGLCAETGEPEPDDPGQLARCALDSLALTYRRVKGELELLLGRPITCIHIGGGGGRNLLLDQLAADACQVPVSVGPVEISALGNACVQLIGLGHLASLGEARALIARSFPARELAPRAPIPDGVWTRFERLAGRGRHEQRGASGARPTPPESRPS